MTTGSSTGGVGKPPPAGRHDDLLHRPEPDASQDGERPASPSSPAGPAGPASAATAPPAAPAPTASPTPTSAAASPASPLASSVAARPGSPPASTAAATTAPGKAATWGPAASTGPASGSALPPSPPRSGSLPADAPSLRAGAASPPPPAPGGARPTGSPSLPASTAAPPSATGSAGDDPALPEIPERYDEDELRAAAGAASLAGSAERKRRAAPDGDGESEDANEPRRRSPKVVIASAVAITAGLGIATLAILGYLNGERYILACEATRAVPEQGRGFPPWGTRALAGEQWRPLKIAPETRCQPQETDDPLVLERAFLAMVMAQATALLTAREVTRVDDAQALLEQALLLTRPPEHEPEPLARQRAERHAAIERLLGDVTYWRATARLRDAAAALGDAAKQFDAAVAQHPRHVSDAAAWAAHARKLTLELHAGPAGSAGAAAASAAPASVAPPAASPPAPAGASERAGAPAGVALPVQPAQASASPQPEAAPPADARVPTGGVLL